MFKLSSTFEDDRFYRKDSAKNMLVRGFPLAGRFRTQTSVDMFLVSKSRC